MPVVSSPQADRAARLVYVRSYTDANIWRVEAASPGAPATPRQRRDLLDSTGCPRRFGARRAHMTFVSAGRERTKSGGRMVRGPRPFSSRSWARTPGGRGGRPAATRSRFTPIRREMGTSFSRPPRAASHAISRRIRPRMRFRPSRVTAMDLLQFDPIGTGDYLEDSGLGGQAIQVSAGLGMMAIESVDEAYLYYTEARTRTGPRRCGAFW